MNNNRLPSPEELFHGERRNRTRHIKTVRRKPIPRYTTVRRFGIGFLILVAVLALFVMNLEHFHIRTYVMLSDSMERRIPRGSFLVDYETPTEELKVGDVITYTNERGLSVTHEIVRVLPVFPGNNEFQFRTKGTENVKMDPDIVTKDMIQGKVVFHIPYVGRIFWGR